MSFTEALRLQQKTVRFAPDDSLGVSLSDGVFRSKVIFGACSLPLFLSTRSEAKSLDVAYVECIITAVFRIPKCQTE